MPKPMNMIAPPTNQTHDEFPYLSLIVTIFCVLALVFTFIIGVDMEDEKVVIETKPHEAELRVEETLDKMFPGQWEDVKLVITIEKKD